MNFFQGEKEMLDYFESMKLDYETTYGLDLEKAFEVAKKTFSLTK